MPGEDEHMAEIRAEQTNEIAAAMTGYHTMSITKLAERVYLPVDVVRRRIAERPEYYTIKDDIVIRR